MRADIADNPIIEKVDALLELDSIIYLEKNPRTSMDKIITTEWVIFKLILIYSSWVSYWYKRQKYEY